MTREFLKGLGVDGDALERIMAEHGKQRGAEKDKKKDRERGAALEAGLSGLKAERDALAAQKAELERALAESPDAGEAARKAAEEAEKKYSAALAEAKKEAEARVAALKRDSETADFLRGLGRRFATPETEAAFRERINGALADREYEGKSRADIFAELANGPDGMERADIFAHDAGAPPRRARTACPAAGRRRASGSASAA